MPFIKVNPKEDKNKLRESSPELIREFNTIDKEFELLKEVIEFRKSQKITQEDIADKSGLSQQSVSRIENQGVEPTLRSFIKYVDAVGLQLVLRKKSDEESKRNTPDEMACAGY